MYTPFIEPGDIPTIFFNDDSSSLIWTAPTAGCPVDEYLVEYKLLNLDMCSDDPKDTFALNLTTSDLFVQLDDLKLNSEYTMNVTAINDAGSSNPASLSVTTQTQGRSLQVMIIISSICC